MRKLTGRVSKKKGLPPGALVHVGDRKTEATKILVVEYNEGSYNICDTESIAECSSSIEKPSVRWIDIVGIDRVDVVAEAGASTSSIPSSWRTSLTPASGRKSTSGTTTPSSF